MVAWWFTSAFRLWVPYLRVRHKRGLELRIPPTLDAKAAALQVWCVRCGAPIFCFRRRQTRAGRGVETTGAFYLAVTCPSDVNPGCGRGKAASEAYDQIEKMVA